MLQALAIKIKETLPPSTAFRHTECSPNEANFVIHLFFSGKVMFMAHAKNELDAYRIKKLAKETYKQDIKRLDGEIVIIPIFKQLKEI
jgi:hypothetical protein